MGAPSLYELAKKACIRNVAAIIDIGDATFEQVRPVLVKVQNAEQLHDLETNCPQLIGHTEEIWKTIIRKDIEGYSKEEVPEPLNPESWYKLYRKLRRREQRAIQEQEEALIGQLQNLKDTAAERTSRIVDAKALPHLRKALGGRTERRPGASVATKGGDPSTLRFASGSRTKAASGQGVLNKARREAKEMSLFTRGGTSNSLARPTHQLISRAQAPNRAPKSLVEDHQRKRAAQDGDIRPGSIAVPRRSSASHGGRDAAQASSSSRGSEARSEKRRADDPPKEVKTAKVPRVAAAAHKPSPEPREHASRPMASGPRPRKEPDIFISPQKRRKM